MSFGDALISRLNVVARTKPRAATGASGSPAKRLAYILSPKTGASVGTVAKLAGVSTRTVRSWMAGGTPSKSSAAKIDNVYNRFLDINNRSQVSVPRLRKVNQVKQQVSRSKLRLTNSEDNDRTWMKPAWWDRFLDAWASNDSAQLDEYWNDIIASWDYYEPWQAHLIEDVEII